MAMKSNMGAPVIRPPNVNISKAPPIINIAKPPELPNDDKMVGIITNESQKANSLDNETKMSLVEASE